MMNRTVDTNSAVYTTAYKVFETIRDNATKKQFDELREKVRALNDYTLQDVCKRILLGVDEWLTDENSTLYPFVTVKHDTTKGTVSWAENDTRVLFPWLFENSFDELHAQEVKTGKQPAEQTKRLFDNLLQAKLNKAVRVCFGYVVRERFEDVELAEAFITKYNDNPRVKKHAVDENGQRVKDDYSANSITSAINEVLHAVTPNRTISNIANSTAQNIARDMVTTANVEKRLNDNRKLSDTTMQKVIINKLYAIVTNTKATISNLK